MFYLDCEEHLQECFSSMKGWATTHDFQERTILSLKSQDLSEIYHITSQYPICDSNLVHVLVSQLLQLCLALYLPSLLEFSLSLNFYLAPLVWAEDFEFLFISFLNKDECSSVCLLENFLTYSQITTTSALPSYLFLSFDPSIEKSLTETFFTFHCKMLPHFCALVFHTQAYFEEAKLVIQARLSHS